MFSKGPKAKFRVYSGNSQRTRYKLLAMEFQEDRYISHIWVTIIVPTYFRGWIKGNHRDTTEMYISLELWAHMSSGKSLEIPNDLKFKPFIRAQYTLMF